MSSITQADLSTVLEDLTEALDVSEAKYDDAESRYKSVSNTLSEDGELAPYKPVIYPQGSFALGTAIHPLGKEDYDIDAVCVLTESHHLTSQEDLKNIVGKCLKASCYGKMLQPVDGGRRCWTIQYADDSKFHLDLLPAKPEEAAYIHHLVSMGVPWEMAAGAIRITDKETWHFSPEWPKSNPKGYLEWFKQQMLVVFNQRRMAKAAVMKAEVEKIPVYKVRTPLQRMVQLLKRHRDLMFQGNPDKPISIIITTLAAHAYNNEEDLLETMLNAIPRIQQAIENRDGTFWVPNPVNPAENFADKWENEPQKAQLFFHWLKSLEEVYQRLSESRSVESMSKVLDSAYGPQLTSNVVQKRFGTRPSVSAAPRIVISDGPQPWKP